MNQSSASPANLGQQSPNEITVASAIIVSSNTPVVLLKLAQRATVQITPEVALSLADKLTACANMASLQAVFREWLSEQVADPSIGLTRELCDELIARLSTAVNAYEPVRPNDIAARAIQHDAETGG